MEPCEEKFRFISMYFYQNGMPCKPERIRVRRYEVDKHFIKNGKYLYHHGKA